MKSKEFGKELNVEPIKYILENNKNVMSLSESERTALLEEAWKVVKQVMVGDSPSLCRWQVLTDDSDVLLCKDFIKEWAIPSLQMESEKELKTAFATPVMISLLPLEGSAKGIMVREFGKNFISLPKALRHYGNSATVVSCLLSPLNNWRRWPEFLLEKVRYRRISRKWLAKRLGFRGPFKKQRVVLALEWAIKKK